MPSEITPFRYRQTCCSVDKMNSVDLKRDIKAADFSSDFLLERFVSVCIEKAHVRSERIRRIHFEHIVSVAVHGVSSLCDRRRAADLVGVRRSSRWRVGCYAALSAA